MLPPRNGCLVDNWAVRKLKPHHFGETKGLLCLGFSFDKAGMRKAQKRASRYKTYIFNYSISQTVMASGVWTTKNFVPS